MSAVPDFGPDSYDAQIALIPEGYDSETRTALMAAISVGWSLTVAPGPSGSLKIASPDGKVEHHFTIGRKVRWSRVKRDILDHAAPERLEALSVTHGAPWEVIEAVLFSTGTGGTARLLPEEKPAKAVREVPLHVVKVEKMLASAGKAGGYESEVALERTWSDGTVDYKCVKCDTTSKNRLSIRSHWRKHINAGEVEPADSRPAVQPVEVPNAACYAPRAARVDALAEILADLLAEGGDPREVAKAALTWVHEQSKKGTRLAAEADDLDDGDILQRIRTLLLTHDPEFERRSTEVNELRNQQASLQEEVLRLQRGLAAQQQELMAVQIERDRFKSRAARAAGDLEALRDLLNSATRDEEEDKP